MLKISLLVFLNKSQAGFYFATVFFGNVMDKKPFYISRQVDFLKV